MTSEEMQRSAEGDYEAHSGALPSNSVYDFLYQDVRRVASFLSQFEEHGVRSAVKATESAGRAQAVKGAATGQVGVPLIANASANVDVTTTDDTKDIAEHTFDPLWANSRRLLDYLTEQNLIERDIKVSNLGQFVLATGSISIVDTQLLDNVFKNEQLFQAMFLNECKDAGIDPRSDRAVAFRNDMILASQISKSIHLFLYSKDYRIWSTLSHESLVTSAQDIALKHGSAIIGQWSILGIMDAYPDAQAPLDEEQKEMKQLEQMAAEALPDGLLRMSANFTNLARSMLGRPRDRAGVTPLLIFREVSG